MSIVIQLSLLEELGLSIQVISLIVILGIGVYLRLDKLKFLPMLAWELKKPITILGFHASLMGRILGKRLTTINSKLLLHPAVALTQAVHRVVAP
jgi:hypothetical protein